jgi:hypothetical protein
MTSPLKVENAKDWVVVVSSCDAYSDLWPYFFHFLFKYWPDAGETVYLISNYRTFNHPRVKTIAVGEDLQWGANTRKALEKIPASRILLLLDDFLFNEPFNHAAFITLLEQHINVGGRLVELNQRGQNGERVAGTWFRRADAVNYGAGINANLWTKELLAEIAQPGLNIWQCESNIRVLLRQGESRLFFMDEQAPKIISYVESVKGQFWKPSGVAHLRQHGFEPDLSYRPCPPQGRDFFSKAVRSFHKRRMKSRRLKQGFRGINVSPVQPL